MAQLRSLGVQLVSSLHSGYLALEGSTWYEDGNGHISRRRPRDAMSTRYFDANYVTTLYKAAPNLDELELIGPSNGNIVRWVTHFHLPRLNSALNLE